MGVIRQLDSQLINQIAAGEVIERPASVVKELLENAIDAGATQLRINLEQGGISSIDVQDDGKGMDRDDLTLCAKRHTTSKLKDTQGLFSITTLGFRGEALASIASVSKMTIITRQHDKDGLSYNTHTDTVHTISAPKGTRIIVKELFYNTPARRKYLKTSATELRRCMDVVYAYALAYHNVGIRVTNNGNELCNVAAAKPFDRIVDVLGKEIGQHMISIAPSDTSIQVSGHIAKPQCTRTNRRVQFFFVNKRLVTNTLLSSALQRGYEQYIHHGTYPVGVVHMTIDPSHIDVNAHPTKAHIRFSDESSVYRSIVHAVRNTLVGIDLIRNIDLNASQQQLDDNVSHTTTTTPTKRVSDQWSPYWKDHQQSTIPVHEQKASETTSFRVLGCVMRKYIVAENPTGLVLVDFHAAHERINYTRLQREYDTAPIRRQKLVDPVVIEVSGPDMRCFEQNEQQIQRLGYEAEVFGEKSIMIRTVPVIMGTCQPASSLSELLADYQDNERLSPQIRTEKILIRMACRMSYMAGDELTLQQMRHIIESLHELDLAFSCPHGRPLMARISPRDLDTIFERIR